MLVNVNADLFRIAALCQETRYYLCGVYIEPHAVGVTLTATDGHVLVSIHDETGQCNAPHIVHLSKDALRACKTGKKEFEPRRVIIEDDVNKAFVKTHTGVDMAVTQNPFVDGTFPHWRAVVHSSRKPELETTKQYVPTFAHDVLRVLCDVARELNSDRDSKAGFTMTGATTGGAATVRFTGAPHAFALAMPITNDDKVIVGAQLPLPSWYQSKPEIKIAA